MYKFILVLALVSSNAFASSNILPETKNARKPASGGPPALDQVRVLLVDRTFQRNIDWGQGRGAVPFRVENCGSPIPKPNANREGPQGGIGGDFTQGAKIYPPLGEVGPECYATVSTAASTKAYIDYLENQLAQNMDRYVKAIDQKISDAFVQKTKDTTVQDLLQKEAVRILEANAALRNQ